VVDTFQLTVEDDRCCCATSGNCALLEAYQSGHLDIIVLLLTLLDDYNATEVLKNNAPTVVVSGWRCAVNHCVERWVAVAVDKHNGGLGKTRSFASRSMRQQR
jgi:hypothetical protein